MYTRGTLKYRIKAKLFGLSLAVLLLLFIQMILCSCSVKRVVQKENREEKIRVEYREILRTDTVTVQLPAERSEVISRDSSRLETSLAMSGAWILPDGTLRHTLENKPFSPKIEVRYKDRETVRDSIVYRTMEMPYPVEKELNWWQKLRMNAGGWAIIVLTLVGGWKLYRLFKR